MRPELRLRYMVPNFNVICQYEATQFPVYMRKTCWKKYHFHCFREARHSDGNILKMSDVNTGTHERSQML